MAPEQDAVQGCSEQVDVTPREESASLFAALREMSARWHEEKDACVIASRSEDVDGRIENARSLHARGWAMNDCADEIDHLLAVGGGRLRPAQKEHENQTRVNASPNDLCFAALRRIYEREQVVHFWGSDQIIRPAVCDRVIGDGDQLFWFSAIMTRPNYYVIRVPGDWEPNSLPDGAVDQMEAAIEECFGNAEDMRDDEDSEGDELPDFPAYHDGGCSWGRIGICELMNDALAADSPAPERVPDAGPLIMHEQEEEEDLTRVDGER